MPVMAAYVAIIKLIARDVRTRREKQMRQNVQYPQKSTRLHKNQIKSHCTKPCIWLRQSIGPGAVPHALPISQLHLRQVIVRIIVIFELF